MAIKYSYQNYEDEKMAVAIGRNLSISAKQAVEICSYLKGKTDARAEVILEQAIAKKEAIPFTRFTEGAGHKPGMASGKFPVNAATQILSLLKSARANAENKGLGLPLIIVHAVANKASNTPRYGRQRGRSAKRTHVEIVLAESKDSKKVPKKAPKKEAKPKKEKVETTKTTVTKEAVSEKKKEAPKKVVKKKVVKKVVKKEE